jgi:hypothetical protein
VYYKVPGLLLLVLLLIPVTSAFDLQQVTIRIDQSGDAVITANYAENPAEYLGVRSADLAGSSFLKNQIGINSPGDISFVCNEYGVTVLRVSHFAEVTGKQYKTPLIDLSPDQAGMIASVVPVSLNPEVTIIFPDGYYVTGKENGSIQPVSHALGQQQKKEPPAPARSCHTRKDLPLSGILPDELAPAAAVGTGIAVTAIGLSAVGSSFSLWFGHLIAFLQNAVGGLFAGKIGAKDKGQRTFDYLTERRAFSGFSIREVIVLAGGALLIGILFFFATRNPLDPVLLGIYIVMGGFALILHEMGHWYLTKKYQCYTEVRFWGLGMVIMIITSWLFGNVFAQPTMTLVRHREPLAKRSLGLIMLSGPVLSVLIALVCLCLVPLGGIFRTAGIIGFSINMLTGVYELLPIPPCDGKEVKEWSGIIWALIFIPLMVIYLIVTF